MSATTLWILDRITTPKDAAVWVEVIDRLKASGMSEWEIAWRCGACRMVGEKQ